MKAAYIYHSGFLVETKEAYYLFDYFKGKIPVLTKSKPITVFSSHGHSDHYNPKIFAILKEMGIKDILAVLSADISEKRYPEDVEILKVYGNKTYTLPHGEILETLLSTDCGVAFLLNTGEGVVYHAGDLNDWTWSGESDSINKQMRENYRYETDKLRNKKIDIAFLPLDPRQEEHYADGMKYFLSTVNVAAAYPMHYWEKPNITEKFLKKFPQYKNIVKYTEKTKES